MVFADLRNFFENLMVPSVPFDIIEFYLRMASDNIKKLNISYMAALFAIEHKNLNILCIVL